MVIHENRGLNPYIEDVARRVAAAGFLGFAPDAAGKSYSEYTYEDANHGFHNDTTPRYDPQQAELAWRRTIEFFRRHLV